MRNPSFFEIIWGMKNLIILLPATFAAMCVCAANSPAAAGAVEKSVSEKPRLVARFDFEEASGAYSDDTVSGLSADLTRSAKWAT